MAEVMASAVGVGQWCAGDRRGVWVVLPEDGSGRWVLSTRRFTWIYGGDRVDQKKSTTIIFLQGALVDEGY
ncbi:MAG: hypothetical protein R3B95_11715 [Nitrospirales bacterium]|nr:hypothetical protein [Nitrospirales bacterium]